MADQPIIFVVDDNDDVRSGLSLQLESAGFNVKAFESGKRFLREISSKSSGCLLLDVSMPEMGGLEVQSELLQRQIILPIIFLTGYGDIPMAVRAIQAGALDFLTKPVDGRKLIDLVQAAMRLNAEQRQQMAVNTANCKRLENLTVRERDVLKLALAGYPNKKIARHFNISIRTVEQHRSHILQKTEASNLLELARINNDVTVPQTAISAAFQ